LTDKSGDGVWDDELLPGQPEFERSIAQGEFDYARARFVRSLDADKISQLIERAGRQRKQLRAEIDNLRLLTRARHETAIADARAYGEILPHRVGKTWIQPPGGLERIGEYYGAEKAYKRAARSAKEYVEARDLLVKRRQQLLAYENELRRRLDKREEALMHQLDSPRTLKVALKLDPLLNIAYEKLKVFRADLQDPTAEDGLADL
jgi:hypothetical protein